MIDVGVVVFIGIVLIISVLIEIILSYLQKRRGKKPIFEDIFLKKLREYLGGGDSKDE